MKRLWTKLRARWDALFRQRITLFGFLFSLATAVVGAGAFVSANNLLFLMLAAMLSTLLVAGFIGKLSLAGLEVDFILPDHVSARRLIRGRIRVRNQKRWMSSFSISLSGSPGAAFSSSVYFPCVPGGASVEESVEVCFAHRGLYPGSNFEFSTRFPFGFTERRVDVDLGGEVLVYPALEAKPGVEKLMGRLAGEIQQHFRGRGNDFYRIRPYEPLESARHVDWKATAHTGELQVREFAREQEHLVELYLDLNAGPEHREWFETAVEYTAYIVWRIAERSARIHLRTSNFDHRLPEECDVFTILKYLALVEPGEGARLLTPAAAGAYRLVITTDAARVRNAGWHDAHILTPASMQ